MFLRSLHFHRITTRYSTLLIHPWQRKSVLTAIYTKYQASTATMAQLESKANDDNTHSVAVIQMTSTTNIDQNFNIISNMMQKISKYPVEMVFLPEAFAFIGDGDTNSKDIADQSIR
eukprot:412492_1